MAFGNGSHVLKRGFLRPNGGSRLPVVLIIALVIGCTLLLYNVYTTTLNRNSLEEELGLLRKKSLTCSRDKTELETRFETHMKSYRTMKEELERLRTLERSSVEVQKELKECREKVVTLQNENAELKEEQKADIEICQRKLKQMEEKSESCVQSRIKLEDDVEKLRLNLSMALRDAQLNQPSKNRIIDNRRPQPNLLPAIQEPEVDNGVVAAPGPPHRGVSDNGDKVFDSGIKMPLRDSKNGRREESIDAVAINDDKNLKDGHQIQAPIPDVGGKLATNGSLIKKISPQEDSSARNKSKSIQGEFAEQKHKQASSADDAQSVGGVDAKGAAKVTPEDNLAVEVPKGWQVIHAHGKDQNDTNATSIHEHDHTSPPVADSRGVKDERRATTTAAKRTRSEKRRRLNKVIEESAPVDERRRSPHDPNNDRSRGEQDDGMQQSETTIGERVTLKPAVPKRMNVDDSLDRPSETKLDSVSPSIGNAKNFGSETNSKIEIGGKKGADSKIEIAGNKDANSKIEVGGNKDTNSKIEVGGNKEPNSKSQIGDNNESEIGESKGRNAKTSSIGENKDVATTTTLVSVVYGANGEKKFSSHIFVEEQKENRLHDNDVKNEKSKHQKQAGGKKGLKDDYQYKDDDEETESLKNGHKKAEALDENARNEPGVELKEDKEPLIKKGAKLGSDEMDLDKKIFKPEDTETAGN